MASISKQLADLREYTARLEIENKGLKLIAVKLASKPTPVYVKRATPSFRDQAIAYCKANKCNSVPPAVVLQWRQQLHAAA